MPGWCRWTRERLARFRHLPPRPRRYLVQAILSLMAARLVLRTIPYKRLTWFFERRPRLPEVTGAEREQMRRGVRWLMEEAAWFLPGETACFPRAIVAQAMLRRHGCGTTLCYGAAMLPGAGLKTHTWVEDGKEGVVGHEIAADYRVLARYPEPTTND